MALSPLLVPVPFEALPGWPQAVRRPALDAFRRSAFRAIERPYRTGTLGIAAKAFEPAFAAVREFAPADDREAAGFFERHFRPVRVDAANDPSGHGFVTGFYEPVVAASPVREGRFSVPLLARPDDLVDIDPRDPPAGIEPGFAFARRTDDRLVEYFDRPAIEGGALAGRGLEIAWVEDPVDAFFIHVQGAARLATPDGSERRVTYAAKSGHPFTGPGGILVALGEIAPAEVTMQSIRAWFRANPGRIAEILHRNRSYIFFRQADVDDPELGPVAAAKVPLTPGHSIAVDRSLHTFATPVLVDAPRLDAFGHAPFRRLMIAQDTGSAIVGAARGDLFAGSGAEAGEVAGVIRHEATFHLLIPRGLCGDARDA